MRTVTGAILLLAAEQAYYHAHAVDFPHQAHFLRTYTWVSAGLALLGAGFVLWGVMTERKSG